MEKGKAVRRGERGNETNNEREKEEMEEREEEENLDEGGKGKKNNKFDGVNLMMEFVEFPKKGEKYKKNTEMRKRSTDLNDHDWKKVENQILKLF